MEDAMEADQTPATAEPAAGAVIVYRCGLRDPLDWGRDCDDQLYLMTRLWNTLVEIEHAHREAYFAATASDPVVAAIEAEITGLERLLEQLYAQRAELRKAARKRVRTPELDERIAELKAKLKARRAEAKEARKAARETIKPQLETLEAERREAVKVARNASGLWWGNYNAVCADYDRARSAVIKRGGKLWIRVFPDKPVTKKPAETRMGSGKGNPEFWVAVVRPGRVLFELAGVDETNAKHAMVLAAHKLPIPTKFVSRVA